MTEIIKALRIRNFQKGDGIGIQLHENIIRFKCRINCNIHFKHYRYKAKPQNVKGTKGSQSKCSKKCILSLFGWSGVLSYIFRALTASGRYSQYEIWKNQLEKGKWFEQMHLYSCKLKMNRIIEYIPNIYYNIHWKFKLSIKSAWKICHFSPVVFYSTGFSFRISGLQ